MMKENDLLILNVHRRYIDKDLNFGGFSGIYLISAFLDDNGFEAQAFAGHLIKGKGLIDTACRNNLVKVIGLYCDYENVTENIFLSNYVKKEYGLPVIVGGPQATALDKNFYIDSMCDAVVRYEGEITVLELMRYFVDELGSLENIEGISYLVDGEIKINTPRGEIQNLDSIPFIDAKYSLDDKFCGLNANIMTGRGCPFNCSFCHEGYSKNKVRFRSVGNVLAEIDKFLESLGKHQGFIAFTDDTFTLVPERVKAICEGLKTRKAEHDFNWYCEGHIHTLYTHPEMIEYMADAGLLKLQLGIESGVQPILDVYRKGCTLDEIRSVIKKCVDCGIKQIYGNIILGGPLFNADAYKKHLDFALELLEMSKGTLELGVVSFWPLAETDITRNPDKYGVKIVDANFYTASSDFPMVEIEELSVWDICNYVNDMTNKLKNYMVDLILNNKVPLRVIKDWFKLYNDYGIISPWLKYLSEANMMAYGYFDMLSTNEVERFDEIPRNNFLDFHPMRVNSMYEACKLDGDATILFGEKVDLLTREVVRYSVGKLSVKEIISLLNNKEELDGAFTEERIVEIYKRLADNYSMVFSRY